MIHGKASIAAIARLLLEEKKKNDKLEIRGIFFDGEVYAGDKGVEQASKLPTREEAVRLIVAPSWAPGASWPAPSKAPAASWAEFSRRSKKRPRRKRLLPRRLWRRRRLLPAAG